MAEQQPLLPMASGEVLRARRLQQGLSLQQVSAQIKCPQTILEALEQDQPVSLASVYLRGHIKRYCALLQLDEERCQGVLDRYATESPGVQTVFETRPRVRSSDRWLRVASYVLASLLVGTLAWQVTHEAVRLTSVDSAQVPADSPVVETDTGVTQHVNASIASLESLRGQSSRTGSKTGNAGLQAWRAIEAAQLATTDSASGDGAHRLVLETSADSWVEITGANDELLEQDLLRGGESRQYNDDGPFRVSLGRSSAVNLSLDGQPIDLAPFTRDDVARLLLDPSSLVSTENPGAGNMVADSASTDITESETDSSPTQPPRPTPEG